MTNLSKLDLREISTYTLHNMIRNADNRIARMRNTLHKDRLEAMKDYREGLRIEIENRSY